MSTKESKRVLLYRTSCRRRQSGQGFIKTSKLPQAYVTTSKIEKNMEAHKYVKLSNSAVRDNRERREEAQQRLSALSAHIVYRAVDSSGWSVPYSVSRLETHWTH